MLFGCSFQLNFMFSLDIIGSMRVDSPSFIGQVPNVETILGYVEGIPEDELVEPYLTTPFTILDLCGYKGNLEFNMQYPQLASVYGFCNEVSLVNTTFNAETGVVSFVMIDYPSIVESGLCFGGDMCEGKSAKLITEQNFTLWKTRLKHFTRKHEIFLKESMEGKKKSWHST